MVPLRLIGAALATAAVGATASLVAGVGQAERREPPAPRPVIRPVAAGLSPFADCAELRDWYVQRARAQVGPYGWTDRGWSTTDLDGGAGTAERTASAADGAGRANSATGTNTQEAGVDEPDVAKTDGRIVARLVDRRLQLTDVTGAEPRDLGRWRLPAEVWSEELLLVGDRVVVLADTAGASPATLAGSRIAPRASTTRVLEIDVADPESPRLVADRSYPGTRVTALQYDDTVRLVWTPSLPDLAFAPVPREGLVSSRAERRATATNLAVLERSAADAWTPQVRDNLTGASRPAVACDRVHRPVRATDPTTSLVTTFRPGEPALDAVAVAADGQQVYSSTDRLYLTATDWQGAARTEVHAFALGEEAVTYSGSGRFAGSVRDRWSLDEYDGRLRVAVSWPDRTGRARENGVVVLEERGRALAVVGTLRGLGRGEEMQSVRWFDGLAVLVTFRQVDPLYTIDLSEPARPRAVGELKIPGFSAYLHPIGGDRLLGIGVEATDRGEVLGAQAGVFDVAGLREARPLDRLGLGSGSHATASYEPRALTWLPDASAAITTLERPDRPWPTVVRLDVAPDGSLSETELPSPGGYVVRTLPLDDGRIALVGDRVELVEVGAGERSAAG